MEAMHHRFASVVVAAIFVVAPFWASVTSADPSPTGREPRLLWTPERQAVWNRMRADYERDRTSPDTLGGQWYKLVKDNAECGCRYADNGLWATFMYQWTGDRKYVDLAWTRLSGFIKMPVSQTSGNFVREYGIEYVVLLDWLWPGLTPERRTELSDAVGAMLDNALNGNRSIDGYRLNDSDQVVGTYFGVALFNLIQPNHPRAKSTFFHPKNGGLSATAADRANARNSVRLYVEMAAGGEWIESAQYNIGTVNLLLMGADAVRTATGVDHFPEVTKWLPSWGQRQLDVLDARSFTGLPMGRRRASPRNPPVYVDQRDRVRCWSPSGDHDRHATSTTTPRSRRQVRNERVRLHGAYRHRPAVFYVQSLRRST